MVEGFLRDDIKEADQRRFVFGTDYQLELFIHAKIWYVDGTFKVVRAPFTQMMSVHAFVCQGDKTKQVPMVFVLVSARRRRDYHAVFKAIRNLLSEEIRVEKMVQDFKKDMWRSIPRVVADVTLQKCNFHWT